MSDGKPVIDEAWDSAVGTLHWIKSLLLGEFVDNRPLSALIVEMMANFAPFVVIVTSARDAVAVIVRLARHPEKRDETMEWVVLAACMITLALPLVAAAGGAVFAGVGAVVGGIAGSELGAALRAVMLLLVKETVKLGDVIRFLQKFVKGDLIAFLRAIEFAKYERSLLMAFDKTTGKLLEICRGFRSHLERFKYVDDVKRAIATLEHWEREFYAVQIAATKKLPLALAELQLRLTKVLAQTAPKESHAVNAAVKAMPPTKAVIPTQYIEDTAGKSLKPMLSEVSDGKSTSVKAPSKNPSAPSESAGGTGGGDPGKPPRKEKPQKVDKPPEGPNTKRQEVVDEAHHNESPSVSKFDHKGARGPSSGRQFDPTQAGGPIRKLTTDGVQISHEGIDNVERHISRFGQDDANDFMVKRLRDIADGKINATQYDLNYYTHELTEFERYKNLGWEVGQPADPNAAYELWNNTHTATLEDFGLKDGQLYHPDAPQ